MNGVILYLFGFAGCGKLTIARAIQSRYDCILVDNHRINNVIFSVIDPDGKTKLPPRVWKNVALVRWGLAKRMMSSAKDPDRFDRILEILQQKVGFLGKILLPMGEHLYIVEDKDGLRSVKCDCGCDYAADARICPGRARPRHPARAASPGARAK